MTGRPTNTTHSETYHRRSGWYCCAALSFVLNSIYQAHEKLFLSRLTAAARAPECSADWVL